MRDKAQIQEEIKALQDSHRWILSGTELYVLNIRSALLANVL
jgi:hypothetical protein